jgi:hypothetical protein
VSLLPEKIINFINSNKNLKNEYLSQFDEPTYISFSFEFEIERPDVGLDLDFLPEGLLKPETDKSSAIQYLKNIGYSDRAKNIKAFIELLKKIQNDFYWSLESITGLDAIFSSKLEDGNVIRLKDKPLTLKFRETLDLKIYAMFDLLKKASYDYVFMRQILPDIMRKFTFKLYIYEVRLFHTPRNTSKVEDIPFQNMGAINKPYNFEQKLKQDVSDVEKFINDLSSGKKQKELEEKWNKIYSGQGKIGFRDTNYFLTVLNDTISVIELTFKQCEFDLQSIKFSPYDELSVSAKHEPATFSININPGFLIETGYYPIVTKAIADVISNRNFNQVSLNIVDYYKSLTDNKTTSNNKNYIKDHSEIYGILIENLLGKDAIKDFYTEEEIYTHYKHLGEADDIVKQRLQDALSAALYDYIKSNLQNNVDAFVGGLYLGNANKINLSDIVNLVTNRPESVIGQLDNILSKATSQSVSNLFIRKLIDSLPGFSSQIKTNPFQSN